MENANVCNVAAKVIVKSRAARNGESFIPDSYCEITKDHSSVFHMTIKWSMPSTFLLWASSFWITLHLFNRLHFLITGFFRETQAQSMPVTVFLYISCLQNRKQNSDLEWTRGLFFFFLLSPQCNKLKHVLERRTILWITELLMKGETTCNQYSLIKFFQIITVQHLDVCTRWNELKDKLSV